MAAVARARVQDDAIDEGGHEALRGRCSGAGIRERGEPLARLHPVTYGARPGRAAYVPGHSAAAATGTMLTTRRPRLAPNSTVPAVSANSVSSPPRPTFSPGWKWVPRWRR